ncbi:MAG: hypothetical protein LBU37_10490 [Tannerellaceae bacterium]|jgi:hypothetical protein|nr:hypothetical protein [Tannerellaceae bacterium]
MAKQEVAFEEVVELDVHKKETVATVEGIRRCRYIKRNPQVQIDNAIIDRIERVAIEFRRYAHGHGEFRRLLEAGYEYS